MRAALDSNVFMYALANHKVWGPPAYEILKMAEDHKISGVASCICLTEVMAGPAAVSPELGEDVQLFMEGLEGLDYLPVDLEIGILAGKLRADYGTKLTTPDALHLATAIRHNADYFVTNDHALLKLKLKRLKIHLLGDPLPLH